MRLFLIEILVNTMEVTKEQITLEWRNKNVYYCIRNLISIDLTCPKLKELTIQRKSSRK